MHISLPLDAELLAKSQADAGGFNSIDEYVANLIRRQPGPESTPSRESAFEGLRQLRKELPKIEAAEIVRSVHEARTDLL
jgi:hypothetical protein